MKQEPERMAEKETEDELRELNGRMKRKRGPEPDEACKKVSVT